MKIFDWMVQKANLKRLVVAYIVVVIVVTLLMGGLVGRVFHDKLTFASDYIKVSQKIEQSDGLDIESIKKDLLALAYETSDIADILILDSENTVIFSAKGANIQKGDSFILEKDTQRDNQKYLTTESVPNVYFKLIKTAYLPIVWDIMAKEQDIRNEYDDEYFYENGFNSKKVYMLSYVVQRTSGDKVYFISDVKPLPNGEFYVRLIQASAMLCFMLYWVLVALWVYADAKRSRLNQLMWGTITLFTNLAGVFLYLIYRQNNITCFHCGTVQDKGNIYCVFCGTKMSPTCPACKMVVSSEDYFCRHCAAPLQPIKKETK